MKSDYGILEAGGTQEDIANYAHDVGGACEDIKAGRPRKKHKKYTKSSPYWDRLKLNKERLNKLEAEL